MSDSGQHEDDCERFLGSKHPAVHVWMDACFSQIGPRHREVRHNFEGVREAGILFGHAGMRAALIHVLRDCLHLPRRSDYAKKSVDALGLPATMSVSDIINFGEEEIMELIERHLGIAQHEDVLIWGWLGEEGEVEQLLPAVSSDPKASIEDIITRWEAAKARLATLSLDATAQAVRYASEEYTSGLDGFEEVRAALRKHHAEVQFGFIQAANLVNPLMIVDMEFVDFLKQELQAEVCEQTAVSFAFPNQINVKVQLLSDARSATVITRFHQFTLSDVRSEAAKDSGIEIRFNVTPVPQMIIVGECRGRFYLKAGMHRAFVLAQSGYSDVPCFIVRENEPPTISGPYPAYSPDVLNGARPPLLLDALEATFTSRIRYRRTNRVLRIASEDFSIPVE